MGKTAGETTDGETNYCVDLVMSAIHMQIQVDFSNKTGLLKVAWYNLRF